MTTIQVSVSTHFADYGAKVHHATATKAFRLASVFAAEYPALTLEAEVDEAASRVTSWTVCCAVYSDDEPDATEILTSDKVPDLADVLEACEEAGVDPEAGVEEEEEPVVSGSVVPEVYRARYRAASSNGQTCGDWLAEWLVDQTTNPETGNLSVPDLTAIFEANDLDMTATWAKLPTSGQKGWVGRYRMNGRQSLERQVAVSQKLYDGRATEVEVPEGEMALLRAKHAKLIAKLEKQAKADVGATEETPAE